MMLVAVLAEATEHFRHNIVFPHQTGNSMPPTGFTALSQCIKYTWITVSFAVLLVNIDDLFQQRLVRFTLWTFSSFLPGVIATSTDTQLPAQNGDRALSSVLVNIPEAIYFFPGNSFSAFRRTAFSWRTLASSFSNFFIFFPAAFSSFTERAA